MLSTPRESCVKSRLATRIMSMVAVLIMIATSVGASPHERALKAHLRFLATSTLIRNTWGRNEDIYLAELTLPSQPTPVLVRLIDNYPSEFPSLPTQTLASQVGTKLSVRRDAQCDIPFGRFLLRTVPGDPMAILPERLGYEPRLTRTPDAAEVLPCYRLMRQ